MDNVASSSCKDRHRASASHTAVTTTSGRSNVLVGVRDDRPFVKVIDFGVAKATTHSLSERTIHTESGAFIGTPEYMSPEQAEFGGLDIDTRTDV